MPTVCEKSPRKVKAEVKQKVLAEAAKMTSPAINERINKMLVENPTEAQALELTCWAEIWLARLSRNS